ncbi:MAG: hypothetical protein Ct9H300mP14_05890 [Gammaproteobacteria bacterium]|nr:MAG: hypothetical protein Ct9H300mP14_05890 [Gammaproteobacteria bacterium]
MTSIDPSCLIDTKRYPRGEQFLSRASCSLPEAGHVLYTVCLMSAEPALAWYQNCVSVPDRVVNSNRVDLFLESGRLSERRGSDYRWWWIRGCGTGWTIARDQSVSGCYLRRARTTVTSVRSMATICWMPGKYLRATNGVIGDQSRNTSELSTYDRARVIGGCSAHNGCVGSMATGVITMLGQNWVILVGTGCRLNLP